MVLFLCPLYKGMTRFYLQLDNIETNQRKVGIAMPLHILHTEISPVKSLIAVSKNHQTRTLTIERTEAAFSVSHWQHWELNEEEEARLLHLLQYIVNQMRELKIIMESDVPEAHAFSPEDTHNWFSIDGDVRLPESMTTRGFADKLEEAGFEFVGTIGYSPMSDKVYE